MAVAASGVHTSTLSIVGMVIVTRFARVGLDVEVLSGCHIDEGATTHYPLLFEPFDVADVRIQRLQHLLL